MDKERSQFLIKNLIRGLLGFGLLILLYLLLKDVVVIEPESWVGRVSDNPAAVYSIFILSEFVVGIIPPEVFMAWAAKAGDPMYYIWNIALLATISYLAGIVGYWIGRILSNAVLYRYARKRFFKQYLGFFRRFGGFLVLVAAITPLPYSAICLVVGSVNYRFNYFLLISLSRFLRFAVYSWLVWQAESADLNLINL